MCVCVYHVFYLSDALGQHLQMFIYKFVVDGIYFLLPRFSPPFRMIEGSLVFELNSFCFFMFNVSPLFFITINLRICIFIP